MYTPPSSVLGEARRLWSPTLTARVSQISRPATDEEWALVYDKRFEGYRLGEPPEEDDEGHIYPVFRRDAYVLANRLAEVGVSPITPDTVAPYFLASWQATGKPLSKFSRALLGCTDGAVVDHTGGIHDLPDLTEGVEKEIDRVSRISVGLTPKGSSWSLESPPSRKTSDEVKAWLRLLLEKARSNGASNLGLYHAALESAKVAGLNQAQLWAEINRHERGGAARRYRARALTRRSALSQARRDDDHAPVLLEGGGVNYILDFERRKYRPLHRGLRSITEQLLAVSPSWPEAYQVLLNTYLAKNDDSSEAGALLFAQSDGNGPTITFLGDGDPDNQSLGRWVSPGVFKARDLRSVLVQAIQAEYVPEVDHWLRVLGGDRAEDLLDWLAVVGDTTVPACALALVGVGDAGKTLLGRSLAELFGGVAKVADKSGQFHDGMEASHIIHFDEGLVGMESARFRELLTGKRHSVNIKRGNILDVVGHYRVLLSANDLWKVLPSSESFSREAGDAIAKRMLVVQVTPEVKAAAMLAVRGCDRVIGDGARFDTRPLAVAGHVRWLIENRKAQVMDAWATSGSQQLVVQGGGLDSLRQALDVKTNHEAYSTLESAMAKAWADAVWEVDGVLYVPLTVEGVGLVADRPAVWAGDPRRTTVQRRQILKDAWGDPIKVTSPGGRRTRCYAVPAQVWRAATQQEEEA